MVRTWLLPFPNRKAYERMLNYSSFCCVGGDYGIVSRSAGCGDCDFAAAVGGLVGLVGGEDESACRLCWKCATCGRSRWRRSEWGMRILFLHRGLGKIAGFLYRKAEHIVVVTPAFREHLTRVWKVPAPKISVVQNGVETGLFSPRNRDAELRKQINAEGKFVVSFIGTIGLAHGLGDGDCVGRDGWLSRSGCDVPAVGRRCGPGADCGDGGGRRI